ncbi:unnamed protein product [Blepharisma stoltei]|uniref:Ribosome biogenesis protein NOP53 n=1 Tax=Blepharisma stoltei TaxID=1481888 RepID=A0AAU9IL89_9CILI|nr:unnamed protein product [Blepharisma stoltei]
MVKKIKLNKKKAEATSIENLQEETTKPKIPKDLFMIDKKGDDSIQKKLAPQYPEKFAKDKEIRSFTKGEKRRLEKLKPSKSKPQKEENLYDLWNDDTQATAPETKKTHIPAVLAPHPGQSYLPSKEEHNDLLEKIIEEEENAEAKKQKVNEILNSYKVVDDLPSPVESEEEDDTPANFIKNPPVKEKFLTNTEKNVKMRGKLKEKLKKIQADERKFKKQIDQLPQIMGEIKKEEKIRKQSKEEFELQKRLREELEMRGEKAPKIRMGKFRYELPETIGVVDLPSNLRKVSVKGNVTEDRFDSLIRRKMIDMDEGKPRKRQMVTKESRTGDTAKVMHEERKKKEEEKLTGNIALN